MTEPRSRRSAGKIVADFEKWVRADEMRGANHPELRDWIHECYLVARERMVHYLTGEEGRPVRPLPEPPQIDYDC